MLIDVRIDGDLASVPASVRALEEAGVAGVFTYEGPGDPFLPLALAATSSTRLAVYSNLAVALPRSPMHLAYLAHDLQRAAGGRFSLGLGTQVARHITDRFGSAWEKPVAQLAEWLAAIRAIRAAWDTGEPLAFEGRWTRHTYCPPLFVPAPLGVPHAPLWVGALGPKMTAMAQEHADGLLLHPFCSDLSVAPVVPRSGFTVVGQAIVAVASSSEEMEVALGAVRGLIAFYASTPAYRPVLDAHGWGALQTELRDLTRAGRWDALLDAVPDEVVSAIALVGTPAEVAAGLARRFVGHDRVALSIPYDVPFTTLAALADNCNTF